MTSLVSVRAILFCSLLLNSVPSHLELPKYSNCCQSHVSCAQRRFEYQCSGEPADDVDGVVDVFTNDKHISQMHVRSRVFRRRRVEYKCRTEPPDDVDSVIDYFANAKTYFEAYCIALYANIKIQCQPLVKPLPIFL